MHSPRALGYVLLGAVSCLGCSAEGSGSMALGGASAGGAAGAVTGVAGAAVAPIGTGGVAAPMTSSGGMPQDMAGAGAGGAAAGSGAGGMAAAGMTGASGAGGGAANPHPLLDVLKLFTAPDVPVRGPQEADPKPRNYDKPLPTRPGKGLAQHPMLYVGENYNRILLVNEGKVIWTYDTQGGFELDDVWLLSNGNVLYTHMTYIEELTPKKEVVWHYEPPKGSEIHTCQPLGLDKVLIGLNQVPVPKLQVIDIKTNQIELEHELPDGASNGAHGQLRRMRKTAAGTYLVALNVPGAQLGGNTQTCERLVSGNTVMFFHSTPDNLQAVEVTKNKEVVWALEDWKNLGDATSAQFLDEPGIPEVVGDTEH